MFAAAVVSSHIISNANKPGVYYAGERASQDGGDANPVERIYVCAKLNTSNERVYANVQFLIALSAVFDNSQRSQCSQCPQCSQCSQCLCMFYKPPRSFRFCARTSYCSVPRAAGSKRMREWGRPGRNQAQFGPFTRWLAGCCCNRRRARTQRVMSDRIFSLLFLCLSCAFSREKPFIFRLFLVHRRFGTKCTGCGQGISPTDLVRRARGKVFHLKCFTCFVCRKQPGTGEELYIIEESRFICKDDYLASRHNQGKRHVEGTKWRQKSSQ